MVAVSPAEWVPVRPPAASVAVVVVPDDGADPEMHSMLAQFETVIVTHDARAGAAALAALSASDAPEADVLRAGEAIADGDLRVDPDRHESTWRGHGLPLTTHERVLLHCLMQPPRRVWTYQLLHERVWGGVYLGDPALVHSAVKRLRRKLALAAVTHQVVTVRGAGFRLEDGAAG
jgi:DNA-binding response OmpR family regulator